MLTNWMELLLHLSVQHYLFDFCLQTAVKFVDFVLGVCSWPKMTSVRFSVCFAKNCGFLFYEINCGFVFLVRFLHCVLFYVHALY